jgi:hypothetical protein
MSEQSESNESQSKLLKKAVLASVLNTPQKSVTTKGVQ